MLNASFQPFALASTLEVTPATDFASDPAQTSSLESQWRGLQSLSDSWKKLEARSKPCNQPMTAAREKVIRLQIALAFSVLNTNPAPHSHEILRAAFNRRAFQEISFYVCGPDGLCYAVLKLRLDSVLHLEELRVSPQVTIPLGWEDGIAPDWQAFVDQLEDLVIQWLDSYIAVRLKVRRELMPSTLELPTGPRIVWADGPTRSVTRPIRQLRELTAEYALSDALPNPRAATS